VSTGPDRGDTPDADVPRVSERGRDASPPSDSGPADPYRVRAKHLLKARGIWKIPVIVGSIMLVLITVFYIGSVVDPVAHLRGLPVSIVNEDTGGSTGLRHVDFGAQLQSGLTGSRTVSTLLALAPQRLRAAESRMNQGRAYFTVVIPSDFTASLLSLSGVHMSGATPVGKPTVELLANRRAGTVGVELADGVLTPAIAQASRRIGRQLLVAARPAPGAGTATAAVLGDPITLTSADYRPLPPHSALGLSAFYIALLALMCGFIGATIINATVDAATGYATTEVGPKWRQRAPLAIHRWQTLLTKWAMALAITGLLTGLMLAVAVGLLGMDAPNGGLLWLFTWLAAFSVAAGTLVLRGPRQPGTTSRLAHFRLPGARVRRRHRPPPGAPRLAQARQRDRAASPDPRWHPLHPLLQRRRQRRPHPGTHRRHRRTDLLARPRRHRRQVVGPQGTSPPPTRRPRLRPAIQQRVPRPSTTRTPSRGRTSSRRLGIRGSRVPPECGLVEGQSSRSWR
jgi:YhgE/Pip-like protein